MSKEWVKENGILVPRLTIPLDSTKLYGLFRFIIKGFLWYHWKVLITPDHYVQAGTLEDTEEQIFLNLFNNASKRVSQKLGGDTIQYEGVQDLDGPELSLWKFTIYGGVKLTGDPIPTEHPSLVWGLTCRNGRQFNFFGE